MIVATPCHEGVAQTHCNMLEMTPHGSRRLREMVAARELEDEVGAALAIAWAQVREREEVWIVSDGICPEEAARLGFRHFASVQEALDAALARKGTRRTGDGPDPCAGHAAENHGPILTGRAGICIHPPPVSLDSARPSS